MDDKEKSMFLLIKAIPRFIHLSLLIIGICVLPLLFSSSCNFNPYQNSTSGDTVTYKVSGIITGQSNLAIIGLAGIRVYLFDSTTLNPSNSAPATDSTGSYTISWPYARRDTLYLKVEDIDPAKSGSYAPKTVKLNFDDDYFKYGIQKNTNVRLDTLKAN
jgi:hypothetical protein